jgi:HD-GYP domain-containing protein (c-di-GMP phosphodiesterase class II)
MVTSRPYQAGRTPQEAFDELQACAGKQFDQTIVDIFLDLWKSGGIKKRNYKDYKFSQR